MLIKQVSILLIDLLLLSFNVLFSLLIDLSKNTQEHLVTLFLIIDLSLLGSLHVVEVLQFELLLLKLPSLSVLSIQLTLLVLLNRVALSLEHLIPLCSISLNFLLKLFEFSLILLNGFVLLIYLFLEGASDLHHVLVMVAYVLPSTVDFHLKIFQAECTLMQTDVQ